ncbi:MAG: aminotransferase class III-fold pyridoxal phosphate-dependent enzyme [Chloroflexi bacterium]|nr:aminotransferase class III-fold pyridoxal phosphate-dependent enzyme [Chloroflexota bacterium]
MAIHAEDAALSGTGEGEERGNDEQRWHELRSGVPPVWARYTDLVVERASGSWIETVDGQRYLDYTCGIGVTNTGHAHPRVVAAIAEPSGRSPRWSPACSRLSSPVGRAAEFPPPAQLVVH